MTSTYVTNVSIDALSFFDLTRPITSEPSVFKIRYRAFVIVQKNQPPQFTAWEVIRRQLGTDYSDPKNFKKKAQAALRKVASLGTMRLQMRSLGTNCIN